MDFRSKLQQSLSQGLLSEKYYKLLLQFYISYREALSSDQIDSSPYEGIFDSFLVLVQEQIQNPFPFAPYHEHVLEPYDYYQFGIDFMKPLVDIKSSSLSGEDHLKEIEEKLASKENVVFLANHQIEADPQAISILLDDLYPNLAKELIFVAGERVTTDPLAIPFSLGRNLLCIYSKRYIDQPPELKTQKQLHNKKTMELMSDLLSEGGHAIYVAPSGGRDRTDADGVVQVAAFDPQSIEMFYLMTQKAKRPTSFYPMALYTYDLLPPPDGIQVELGEARRTKRGAIHLSIGPKLEMEEIGKEELDKRKRREVRANFIWSQVHQEYKKFPLEK